VQDAPAATVVLAGQVIVGAVWSATVTENEQLAVLPAPSVAVIVMIWLPEIVPPAAGLCVLVGVVQLSEAVAEAM
jgi:hypothetical protein